MALHSARERRGLTLEQVRDAIEVPSVDLDALERGQLELFHLQQSAVVALWRYAEFLELEPDRLLPVLHNHWPHRALSVNAFRPDLGMAATPVARLAAAARLLEPLLQSTHQDAMALGLTSATQAELATRRAAEAFATSVLIPAAALATGEPGARATLRAGARPEARRAFAVPAPPGGRTPAPQRRAARNPAVEAAEPSAPWSSRLEASQDLVARSREITDPTPAGNDDAEGESGARDVSRFDGRVGHGPDSLLASVDIPPVPVGEAAQIPEPGDLQESRETLALTVDDDATSVVDVAAAARAARATGAPAPKRAAGADEAPVASGGLGQAMQRSLRYAARLRHIVAERFGMDDVPPLPGAGAGNAS